MFSNAASSGAGVLAAATFLFQSVSAASTISSGCQALETAGLKARVLYPQTAGYIQREASFWSANAPLSPLCIVQPLTTAEVSATVKALASSNGNFTIRSGGHGQWTGASDIHNGVTIDLGAMKSATYNPTTTLAPIQPGPRWGDVYTTLASYGVGVAGGRDADVGIGGFLTGGGNSYYAGLVGFACDTVVNFEVVLANGSIVNANKTSNSDLWRALKGGSGNFGIVTRFDVQAFPYADIWGGLRASNRSYGDQIITNLVNFGNNNEKNPEDSYIVNFTYNPSLFTEIVIASVTVDVKGTVNAPAFNEITKVPELLNDVKTRSMADIATSYVLPSGTMNVWFTLTFRNDAGIVQKAAQLHDEMVAELMKLIPASDFTTQCLFQPIPTYFAQIGVKKGGNMLGMDTVHDNALMWLGTAAVQTAEQMVVVQVKMAALSAAIEAYAKSIGGNIAWRYLNYADGSQDPLSTYGTTNINYMKAVSGKYDPMGVFQKKNPGGFRLSRI